MAEQPRLVEDNSSLVKNDDDPVTSESFSNLISSLALKLCRLNVLRPLEFFRSAAKDLLSVLPSTRNDGWSMLRGSTALFNSTSLLW